MRGSLQRRPNRGRWWAFIAWRPWRRSGLGRSPWLPGLAAILSPAGLSSVCRRPLSPSCSAAAFFSRLKTSPRSTFRNPSLDRLRRAGSGESGPDRARRLLSMRRLDSLEPPPDRGRDVLILWFGAQAVSKQARSSCSARTSTRWTSRPAVIRLGSCWRGSTGMPLPNQADGDRQRLDGPLAAAGHLRRLLGREKSRILSRRQKTRVCGCCSRMRILRVPWRLQSPVGRHLPIFWARGCRAPPIAMVTVSSTWWNSTAMRRTVGRLGSQ